MKLTWNGHHLFETGVEKGVLYPMSSTPGTYEKGVEWLGLTNVSESPEGAEVSAIYADNGKYLNLISNEEFKATIEAFTYPDEFAECNGEKELVAESGVFATQQTRKMFGFSYQTKVGNEENPDLGYKIHIVYGCLAAPTEKSHDTVNDSPEAMTMSWEVSSTPVRYEGFKPISHIVIDSTKVAAAKLTALENKLYGTDGSTSGSTGTDPTLPTPAEIYTILTTNG